LRESGDADPSLENLISYGLGERWDAEPSLEHLILYGPPFPLQTWENRGKPGETRIQADNHKIKQSRPRLDFFDFGVRREGFPKIDILASYQNVTNQPTNPIWDAHGALVK
jgi:hypothetical protein